MSCVRNWVSTLLVFLATVAIASAQVRNEIAFPDIEGYQTLKCDFHTHTVFSDGNVWPTVRVDEAYRIGLDALALSDHIEYQPHKADVPTNHNRPYEIALGRARELGIILIRGAEITRDTPPGHFNAIFLKDVNPLVKDDFVDAISAACEQGGFVFWNHHAWKGEELGRWLDIHSTLYDKKLLHGMEVANGETYYPTAHRWCLEKGLTMVGNSDIHEPDLLQQNTSAKHRTITLVFVTEKSEQGILDALRSGRTAVWCRDLLIAKPEWLTALAEAILEIDPPHLRSKTSVRIKVRNKCAMDLVLKRTGQVGPAEVTLKANTTAVFRINVPDASRPIQLDYQITNFLAGPGEGLDISYTIPAP
jgi:hypothetical protein